jgi:hypothetical protein
MVDGNHEVEIKADDIFDRSIDFTKTVEYLKRCGVKCRVLMLTCE